jgi:glycosyltransferase involved in cell wall biosynthesis
MFGWEYPPHNSGGLGVACQGICEALIEEGHKVTFVLPHGTKIDGGRVPIVFANKAKHTYLDKEEIEILRKLQNPYLGEFEHSELIARYKQQYGMDTAYPFSLISRVDLYAHHAGRLAKEFADVDVIHAHDWLCFGAGVAAKQATGKPLIVHVHATEYDRSGDNINQEVFVREKYGMDMADKIVTVSSFTKDIIVKKYGIDEAKISVVHNGVVQKKTNSEIKNQLIHIREAGNSIVLSLGRITLQKGVDYFVRAAKIVLDYRPKTFFVVAGSGDMEAQIIELTSDLGISNKVLFTGFIRGDTVDMLYKASDVFVMPSLSEPFGIAPLEAMVQGTPVIISKQSGVSEVVSHALKVDFWDVEELANKIIAILDYPELQKTLQIQGQVQVDGITWKNAVKKLAQVYKEVTKK